MPRFIAQRSAIFRAFCQKPAQPWRDIAAELRQKTRHLLKAAVPDPTRRDSKAAEVSSQPTHPRSGSNGQLNASSSVTYECRAVWAFMNEFYEDTHTANSRGE